jgi:ketosteroid isomerase-like protein
MVPRNRIRIGSSRTALTAIVLLTCFLACAYAQQEKHPNKRDERKQVEALEEKWRTAQLAGDIATIDRMLADDFIGISMSGQVNTKAQQLDRIRNHRLVLTRIDLDDMKVKLVGEVAIVTCQARVEGTSEGMSVKGTYRYTRIYRQLPSKEWKITSFEATRIRPRKSATEKQAPPTSPPQAAVQEPRFG